MGFSRQKVGSPLVYGHTFRKVLFTLLNIIYIRVFVRRSTAQNISHAAKVRIQLTFCCLLTAVRIKVDYPC